MAKKIKTMTKEQQNSTAPANCGNTILANGLKRFYKNFPNNGIVYIEDSALWYCLDIGISWYLNLDINARINFKGSY